MRGRLIIRKACLVLSGFTLVLTILSGCSAGRQHWSLAPPPEVADDRHPLAAQPAERDPSLFWDAVHQSSFYFMKQSLDLPRLQRKLTGNLPASGGVDVFGEVPNSSWFTNRHGRRRLSRDELKRGPNTIDGPDLSGKLTITRAKTEGVTPGFFVKDARGETFILKFDPVAYPELATGAEMVSTKFFYACGYHVPENYLIHFDPGQLSIKDGLVFEDRHGLKQPFTHRVLDSVLARVARDPDGSIRAIASRFLPGRPLGPWSYHRTRDDDLNDRIPHEHRRELRGMKVFAQLVNHFDTKDHNSLDILVDEGDGPYIRHYLIDFGSTLGSDGDEPKPPYKGYAYVFDPEQLLVSLFTLGLRKWSWEGATSEGIPASVGFFESERFHPPGWKPLHGNPAFDNMTYEDAFWATRIISAFTKDDLRACVETAEYSDPAATEYLVETLWERRRKILAYYYGKISPLDDFAVAVRDGRIDVGFADRWVEDGFADADAVAYRYRFGRHDKAFQSYRESEQGSAHIVDADAFARIQDDHVPRQGTVAAGEGPVTTPVYSVQIQARHDGRWGPWVRVWFYYDGTSESARVVGIERKS